MSVWLLPLWIPQIGLSDREGAKEKTRVWHNLLEWIETQIRYQVRFMYLCIHLFNSHLCSKYVSMHDGQHMWVSGIKQQEELPFWPRLRLYDNPDVSK